MNETNSAGEPAPEVRDLARSTARLHGALSGLDAEQLARRPAAEEWSAWDIAYHIAQMEVWYFAKLCEATAIDPTAAMERFLAGWQQLRVQGLALAGEIAPARLDRPGLLGGVPDWTPRQLLDRMAAHDREHTEQAKAASAGERPNL
ncbi:MAG: DinB family protein [Dehalococcoidia bacterium]